VATSPARANPRARRLFDLVRAQIRAGELGPDEKLVEHRLTSGTGIGRADVRAALGRLADEGLVTRQPRSGTRVAHSHYRIPANRTVPDPAPAGVRIRVLDARVLRSTELVRARLGLDDVEVGMVERVCEIEGAGGTEPLSVGIGYCRVGHLDALVAAGYHTFEECAEVVYGAVLGAVETVVSAAPADPVTARQLRVAPGTALLSREQVLRGVDGVAYQYVFSHFRGDRVSFPAVHTGATG
jgi:GntR family transcriptional regulator